MTGPRDAPQLTAALAAAESRFAAANPESERAHRAATSFLPGGNTRTSLHYSPFPVTFREGRGQTLTDLDGHLYTDFLGEYSAGLYGHSHPDVMAAARKALDEGIAFGGPNTYEAEMAALLASRYPSVDLLRFTNSGTEANLMAVATAREVTGRSMTIVFEGGYHGSLLSFRGSAPLNAPYPFTVCAYNDVAEAVATIERVGQDLAAVLVEPMLGGGGAVPATPEFLQALRDATTRTGALLIFDEVMTSRLAPGGLQEVYGISPDLTTFGKYLGGGFSFGAFGGARRWMSRYDPTAPASLSHPGTFNNNTLSMAAGAAGLRDVYPPEVAAAHNRLGDRFRDRLNRVFREREAVMQATGLGSIIGIHFQVTPIASAVDIEPANAKRALLHLEMMLRGYYFARRGYLALSVALQPADLDGFTAALCDVLDVHAPVFSRA